jgi:hypothetical protein
MSKVNYIRNSQAEYKCILLVCNSCKLQTWRQVSKVLTFVNTCAPLERLDVFIYLMKSNAPRNRRQFHVSIADYPQFKPKSPVSSAVTCLNLPLIWGVGFKISCKAYAKFYVSNPVLEIRTFHLRVLPLRAILFANLNGTSSFLYNFRLCSCQCSYT